MCGKPSGSDTSQPQPRQFQRWMAFDFGHRRTGVAVGNSIALSCQPLTAISVGTTGATQSKAQRKTERMTAVAHLIDEWQPQALVVGLPLHPDGNTHDMTRSAQKFMRQLAHRFALPVYSMDERYTSVEAEDMAGAGKDIDATAAMLILERFFLQHFPPLSLSAVPVSDAPLPDTAAVGTGRTATKSEERR